MRTIAGQNGLDHRVEAKGKKGYLHLPSCVFNLYLFCSVFDRSSLSLILRQWRIGDQWGRRGNRVAEKGEMRKKRV